MTYRHMNQTEPCNRLQCWCNRTVRDNGCVSATDDPEGQAWHDETGAPCSQCGKDA
jgi:hypothetical protein